MVVPIAAMDVELHHAERVIAGLGARSAQTNVHVDDGVVAQGVVQALALRVPGVDDAVHFAVDEGHHVGLQAADEEGIGLVVRDELIVVVEAQVQQVERACLPG
jgi:hypothetical protein